MKDKINVLLVDDHPENLLALEHLLDDPELFPVKAASGNEALKLAIEHDFAVVLLDVQMPDMDGYETAEWMRRNPQTRHVPIIFITATSHEERHVFKGYEAGAVDYITKPIEPLILKSKVQVFSRLFRQRAELDESRQALARACGELERTNEQLQNELELARHVQMGFLPAAFPHEDRVGFGHMYLACSTLGGDLFDAFAIGSDHVGLYVADVAGHGVRAALICGLLKMGFETCKGGPGAELLQPDAILLRMNRLLRGRIPENSFITLLYAVLDLAGRTVRLSSAGHPNPIHYRAGTRAAAFHALRSGPALGLMDAAVYPVAERAMVPGEKLVLFTDGVPEALNARQEEFGDDRLLAVIREAGARPPDELVRAIRQALDGHRDGFPASDDCSLLVAEIR